MEFGLPELLEPLCQRVPSVVQEQPLSAAVDWPAEHFPEPVETYYSAWGSDLYFVASVTLVEGFVALEVEADVEEAATVVAFGPLIAVVALDAFVVVCRHF